MNDTTATAKRTILVVEDEVPIQMIVRTVLEMHGYHVLTAGDGPTALELIQRHEGVVDLVVSDVKLPGMTGNDLVRQLLAKWPKLRVLYISGDINNEASLVGGEGSPKFLPKPFTPKELLAIIRAILPADGA